MSVSDLELIFRIRVRASFHIIPLISKCHSYWYPSFVIKCVPSTALKSTKKSRKKREKKQKLKSVLLFHDVVLVYFTLYFFFFFCQIYSSVNYLFKVNISPYAWPNGIAIDPENQRLYWTEGNYSVVKASASLIHLLVLFPYFLLL